MILNIFQVPSDQLYVFFGNMFRSSIHFLFELYFFVVVSVLKNILDVNFDQMYDLKIYFPVKRLPFCYDYGFLCCVEAFWFDAVPFAYFCFPCLWSESHKNITKIDVSEVTASVFF